MGLEIFILLVVMSMLSMLSLTYVAIKTAPFFRTETAAVIAVLTLSVVPIIGIGIAYLVRRTTNEMQRQTYDKEDDDDDAFEGIDMNDPIMRQVFWDK